MELKLQTSYRQILGMALPISLAMLVPQINFITNNVFLAGLGEESLASAGITGVYYLIFAVVGSGLNNGLQALIARRAGQSLPHEIGRLFFHGIWVSLAFAAVGIAITYMVAPSILRAVIHNQQMAEVVIDFLLIRIWGLPLLYLYGMHSALLVGTNQTRFLIWGTLCEALVNVVLDYSLIFGKLGFAAIGFNGAAIASIVAEGAGLMVLFAVIRIKKINQSFALFEKITFDGALTKLMLIQSAPLVAQYAISILSWEYFYILIEHHGARALAVSNAMRNVFGFFGIFSWAFAATTNTMVSNIIGQGRHDEVMPLIKRIAGMSFGISLVVFVVLNSIPEKFLSFYALGPEFIAEGIPVVRIISVALLTMSFATVWLNAVTGTGNTIVNLSIELIAIIIYCSYCYVVLEYMNLPIVWGWGSELVYWLSMFTMAFFYLRSGRWRAKVI